MYFLSIGSQFCISDVSKVFLKTEGNHFQTRIVLNDDVAVYEENWATSKGNFKGKR